MEPFFSIDFETGQGSVEAMVFAGNDEVFMALIASTSGFIDRAYCAIYKETVRKVPGCALLYDPVKDCVYIFGGCVSHYRFGNNDSQSCQKFIPSNSSIEQLPDMLEPRVPLECAGTSI